MNLNKYVKVILFVILMIIASMFFITGEQKANIMKQTY